MKTWLILSSVFLLNLNTLCARETDQYLTWQIELRDASELINQYLVKEMRKVVDNPSNAQKSCIQITEKFYKRLIGPYTFSQLSLWAQNGDEMEAYRFPPKSVSKIQYSEESMYGGSGASPIIKWIIGLAPSLNVNGIYFGTDKLGHISYMGHKYYRQYLKLIKKGMKQDEAIKRVVEKGFKSETTLGGFYGTTSPSDLEANYQGLRLAIDLCDAKNDTETPILTKENGKWIFDQKRLQIQNYVTPEFYESYYSVVFGKRTWEKSVKNRVEKICAEDDLTIVKKRFADYRERFTPSLNIAIMNERMHVDARFNNAKYQYQTTCGVSF